MDRTLSQPFGPICEGLDSGFGDSGTPVVFLPEAIYVRQGNKAHFFLGKRTLCESVEEGVQIVESLDALDLVEVIDERTGQSQKIVKDGRWFVEGPYQRSDTKNANGRTYARSIWERIVGDESSPAQQCIKAGGMVGHLEHPENGRMDGREGAIATRKLRLRPDGVVWGVSELLGTPNGLILQEYTRKGVRWGVSSRGNGSVDDTGKVNESDFELVTFDSVLRPSTPGAYPKRISSGKESITTESVAGQGHLNEEAVSCITEVESLRETEVESLVEADRRKFVADLLHNLNRVNSLGRSNGLSDEKVNELQDWLIRKLGESQEASAVSAEEQIDRLVSAVTVDDDTEQDEAFQRVVSGLQSQVESAAEEAETLRAALEATREELSEAQSSVARLMSQREAFETELAGAKEELARIREKLSIARELISTRSTVEVADEKQQAVAEVLEQVQGLEAFRAVLEKAEDADAVFEIAEELLPAVAAKRQEERRVVELPAPIVRRALPARGMVVESDVRGGSQRQTSNPSRGARMAGGAVKRMAVPGK